MVVFADFAFTDRTTNKEDVTLDQADLLFSPESECAAYAFESADELCEMQETCSDKERYSYTDSSYKWCMKRKGVAIEGL